MKTEEIIAKIIHYFQSHEDIFNEFIVELDDWTDNDILHGEKYHDMVDLIDNMLFFSDYDTVRGYLQKMICGRSEDPVRNKFDPYAKYYYFKGNVIYSAEKKNYLRFLDTDLILTALNGCFSLPTVAYKYQELHNMFVELALALDNRET